MKKSEICKAFAWNKVTAVTQ